MGIGAAIGGIAGGLISASGSSKAASAQERAANAQTALEREIYNDTTEKFAPFYDSGLDYHNALRYEILGGDVPVFGGTAPAITENTRTIQTGGGTMRRKDGGFRWGDEERHELTRAPSTREITEYMVGDQTFGTREAAEEWANNNRTGGHEYGGYEASTAYKNALAGGMEAIDGSAASRGGLFSGATLKAQQEFGTELAQQDYTDYLNWLSAGASSGQAAAGNMATAGANFASGAGNALANAGNAQAAGYIGQANAFNSIINNGISAYGYMNQPQGNMLTASNGITVPQSTMSSVQGLF